MLGKPSVASGINTAISTSSQVLPILGGHLFDQYPEPIGQKYATILVRFALAPFDACPPKPTSEQPLGAIVAKHRQHIRLGVLRKHSLMHACAGFLFCLILCSVTLPGTAQSTADLSGGDNKNAGLPEHALFSGTDIDSVQMDSGNLHIEIPLWQVKGRAGLDFWVKLVYDAKGWTSRTTIVPPVPGVPGTPQRTEYFIAPSPSSNMQWAIRTPADYSEITQTTSFKCGTAEFDFYNGSDVIEDPNGTTHNLIPGPTQANSCPGAIYNFNPRYADDASGWMGTVDKEGSKVRASTEIQDWATSAVDGSVTDRNGNSINFTASNAVHTDTLGRVIANDLSYIDSNGTTQTISISYISVPVSTNLCGNRTMSVAYVSCSEYSANWNLPHTVTLANGNSYTINYNQNDLGQPSSLTLPNGATISYTWTSTVGNGLLDASGHRVVQRSISANGATNIWKYDYSQSSQTVITDPLQNDTTYNCGNGSYSGSGLNYFTLSECNPTDIKTFQGSYSGGARKKETQRTYWYSLIPGTTPVLGSDHLLASEITLLDGIPASRTEYDYDTKQIGITSNASTHISWGNVIEKREFNYSSGAWTLARRTRTTYKHLDDPTNYGSRNLASFPSSVSVYDGGTAGTIGLLTQNYTGGNLIAQTLYTYDNYTTTPMQSTLATPAPQHDYTNYSSSFIYRGNVTSVQRMVSGGNFVTTQYSYDDLGNRVGETDARGNPTAYSYSDSWSGSGCVAANTFTYLTKVTDAMNHRLQSTFYPCTGLVQAIRTENDLQASRAGTTYLYDLMGAKTNVSYPDGGNEAFNYHGYAVPLTVTATVTATPDPAIVTSLSYDGLGRPSILTAPNGAMTTTTYDGNGRVNSVSNPQFSSPSPTDGTTAFTYDALGRKLLQCQPDNGNNNPCVAGKSYLQWSYNGNVTTSYDESRNSWQHTSDALGRLTNVVEPGNLQTGYSYNALGNLLSVTQTGVSGETPRSRSFTYDSLGRLITATNPETGTICYGQWSGSNCVNGYDANGNLTAKTDARGITISYGYDALNRVTNKSASDGSINYSYAYDGTDRPGVANPIGRLTQSSNNNASAASHYDYDAMGRVIDNYVCSPSNCSYTLGAAAAYDLAGNMVASRIATGMTAGMSYDAAGRLTNVTATQPGSSTPATLFSNATYGPIGLTEAMLGNGLREEVTYDKRTRVNSYNVGQSTSPVSGGSPPSDYIDFAKNNGNGGSSIPQGGIIFAGGWAIDNEDGAPVAKVEVLLDGNVIGLATLGRSRPDVAAAYNRPDFTNSGWDFTGSIGFVAPGTHMITALAYDSSGNSALTASSVTITVTSDNPPFGSVDAVKGIATGTTTIPSGGLVTVGGWAADIEDGSPVATVRVLLDGVPIGNATLGSSRPDVAAAYNQPAYAKSGWNFTGSVRTASVGNHTISVAAYDSSGNETVLPGSSSITVTANPDSMAGSFDSLFNASNSSSNTISLGGNISVNGWAAEPDQNPGAPVSRVEIEIDGQYLGLATLGSQRPDVASASNRPDFLNSGYSFIGPVTNVDPGEHSIGARMFTKSGGSYLIPLFAQSDQIIVAGTTPALSTVTTPTKYSFALNYAPNGNVIDASDSVNGNWAYSYDSLNRLTSALSPTTGLSWSYDSFGNRWQQTATKGSAPQPVASFTTATNRADGVCYDAAGNALDDGPCPMYGAHKYAYDGEEKLISSGYGATTYIYDAEGRRVGKANSGTVSDVYYYDVAGHLATEIGANSHSDIYVGSRHLATYQGTNVFYNHANWLGTESARSDATGALCETISSLPFGDAQQTSGTCLPSPVFLTGKERDAESGLDYFGARYYGSTMGRFMSPDWASNPQAVPYATYANPQSLNLYNYMRNNPLSGVDADGHWPIFNAMDPNTWKNIGSGVGHVAIALGKTTVNAINFLTGDCSCQSKSIAPLQPNGNVEAATMIAAPLVVPGMSIAVSAAAPAALETESVSLTTTLYRAVDATEQESITSTGQFSASPNGTEYKGFFTSAEGAQNFSAAQTAGGGTPTSVVTGTAPTSLVESSPVHSAATEGPGVLIKNENLPQVKPQ
jgi:RHS repeat-associated protein